MTIVAQQLPIPAVSDYAWLQATITKWTKREDLAADVPEFIRMAELEINRRLKVVAKETEISLACEVGSRFVPLPADFGNAIALWTDYVEPRHEFTVLTTAQLPINDDLATLPNYWAIDGQNIAFNCRADQAYPLALRYVQTLFLSEDNPTNALFASAPDLYLYGALTHFAPYIRDDERLPMWQSKFDALLRSVAAQGARAKSMVPLQTEIPAALCGSRSHRSWGY